MDPKVALREERNLIQHYQNYRLVERLVDIPSSPVKALPRESSDILSATVDWANQLAEKIHREFRLGDYPAALLIKCLEEEYGVLLISCSLEDGSAACYREENGSVVMFNEKEVRWRQTFNLAHELFHLVTWSSSLISQIQSNEDLFQKNEKLADAFAAALLMPQQMIDLDVRGNKLTYSFIVALAGKYQVSKQAMLLRLRYLKFISSKSVELALADPEFLELDHDGFKQAFASIPREIEKSGIGQGGSSDFLDATRGCVPGHDARSRRKIRGKADAGRNRFFSHERYASPLGNRFIRLAYLAYEKGRLSKGRLAQILSVKLRDLNQYLAEKGLHLTHDKEIKAFTC